MLLMTLMYNRNRLTKLKSYYDERSTLLSHFSIIINGMGK